MCVGTLPIETKTEKEKKMSRCKTNDIFGNECSTRQEADMMDMESQDDGKIVFSIVVYQKDHLTKRVSE